MAEPLTAEPVEGKLKEILERTGYPHEITVGRRKYGPPSSWTGSRPGLDSEVYCSNIPREVFEDELIPLFEKCGTIWDLRLMMDPLTGQSQGFCFVTFMEKRAAEEAIKQLHGYAIKGTCQLSVKISPENVRLFVGMIPKSRSKEDIFKEFSTLTEGLCSITAPGSPNDPGRRNRGYTYLTYRSHTLASAAKMRLEDVKVFDCDIAVDWADPVLETTLQASKERQEMLLKIDELIRLNKLFARSNRELEHTIKVQERQLHVLNGTEKSFETDVKLLKEEMAKRNISHQRFENELATMELECDKVQHMHIFSVHVLKYLDGLVEGISQQGIDSTQSDEFRVQLLSNLRALKGRMDEYRIAATDAESLSRTLRHFLNDLIDGVVADSETIETTRVDLLTLHSKLAEYEKKHKASTQLVSELNGRIRDHVTRFQNAVRRRQELEKRLDDELESLGREKEVKLSLEKQLMGERARVAQLEEELRRSEGVAASQLSLQNELMGERARVAQLEEELRRSEGVAASQLSLQNELMGERARVAQLQEELQRSEGVAASHLSLESQMSGEGIEELHCVQLPSHEEVINFYPDPMGALYELTQKKLWPPPSCKYSENNGSSQNPSYMATVKLFHLSHTGEGRTKKAAKRVAAEKLLRILDNNPAMTEVFCNLQKKLAGKDDQEHKKSLGVAVHDRNSKPVEQSGGSTDSTIHTMTSGRSNESQNSPGLTMDHSATGVSRVRGIGRGARGRGCNIFRDEVAESRVRARGRGARGRGCNREEFGGFSYDDGGRPGKHY